MKNTEKNFKYYEYKKITFPVRDCTFTRNGHDLSGVLVGSEVMSEMFFKEDGGFICPDCIAAIQSRGEKVKIVEG